MTTYVYMNERIRKKKPDGPVIVVQGELDTVEANVFEISFAGVVIGHVEFNPAGLDACKTHEVKAWVEFSNKVQLRPIGKCIMTPHRAEPIAYSKEPDKPIQIAGSSLFGHAGR